MRSNIHLRRIYAEYKKKDLKIKGTTNQLRYVAFTSPHGCLS